MELYTIGYEGSSKEHFLKWLLYYRITVVADVRELPWSRKKDFSKTELSKFLAIEDIGYMNFRELGAPKEMRKELKRTQNFSEFFQKYQEGLSKHYDQLDKILSLIEGGVKVVLLCFEKDPKVCHRRVLAEELKEREGNGLRIKHLNSFDLE